MEKFVHSNHIRLILAVIAAVVIQEPRSAQAEDFPRGPDAAPWHAAAPPRPPTYTNGTIKRSLYIPGKDGVRLAIDYYLPKGISADTRLPTILQQTRYFRSSVFTADGMKSCQTVAEDIGYFTIRGYAYAIVDVRGTGASFGTRTSELSAEEIADTVAVADWIVAQPWSSGSIATTGISYVGMLAELALLNRHPAIKAAAPQYAGHDSFADLYYPGGMRNHLHADKWSFATAEMDKAAPGGITTYPEVVGPCPVDDDLDGKILAAARSEHQGNSSRAKELKGVQFRNDVLMPGGTWSGPYSWRAELDAIDLPMLFFAGWHDSAFGDGAINRFLTTRSEKQRLIMGPHSHAGDYFYGPGIETTTLTSFDYKAELLRFFDAHLLGSNPIDRDEPRLRWFVTGANIWRQADSWPEPRTLMEMCLGSRGTMNAANCSMAPDRIRISPADIQSTPGGRWHTTMAKPIVYPDRARADAKLPVFQSSPLSEDLEILGSPTLELGFHTTGDDADLVVYLEEVDVTGRAFYVTEGLLRASHAQPGRLPYRTLGTQRTDLRKDRQKVRGRELRLNVRFFAVAHRFKSGNSLRLVVAGSDIAVFDPSTRSGDIWEIRTGASGSAVFSLPVAR